MPENERTYLPGLEKEMYAEGLEAAANCLLDDSEIVGRLSDALQAQEMGTLRNGKVLHFTPDQASFIIEKLMDGVLEAAVGSTQNATSDQAEDAPKDEEGAAGGAPIDEPFRGPGNIFVSGGKPSRGEVPKMAAGAVGLPKGGSATQGNRKSRRSAGK